MCTYMEVSQLDSVKGKALEGLQGKKGKEKNKKKKM